MEIISSQVPHKFRNRFMRDGNSFMMTNESGGASGGASGGFRPHYVWGIYDDGQTDIVGDFVTSADASIGGNVSIGGNETVGGNLYVDGGLTVEDDFETHSIYPQSDNSYYLGSSSLRWKHVYAKNINVSDTLSGATITDIYDKLQALADLIEDVSSRVPNSSS